MRIQSVMLIMLFSVYLCGAEGEPLLISGVNVESLLLNLHAPAIATKRRSLGDLPPRVMYEYMINDRRLTLGIAVYRNIETAKANFLLEVDRVSVAGAKGVGIGDESMTWKSRVSFRRANVCLCVWREIDSADIAKKIDLALAVMAENTARAEEPTYTLSSEVADGGPARIVHIEFGSDSSAYLFMPQLISNNKNAVDIKVNEGQMISLALVNNIVFTINPWNKQ